MLERTRSNGQSFQDIALASDLVWVEALVGQFESRQACFEHLADRAANLGYLGKAHYNVAAAGLNVFGLNVAVDYVDVSALAASLPPYALISKP